MVLEEKFKLSNGVEIPKLGLGTWLIDDNTVAQTVNVAVEIGYRHIDTAQAYQNERGVGEGIRSCGVNRSEIFVTTKLAAEVKSYHVAVASIDSSLKRLGLDYLDMMIIHSPKPWTNFLDDERYIEGNREAWRALEDAYNAGKIRAIGLSNFEEEDLDNILASCSIRPTVNQMLAHITNTPIGLIEYCQERNILVEAYSPIGHGELLKNEQVNAIAKRYEVTVSQLGIRYCLQLGMLPLPKTSNVKHMKINSEVDFVITDDDMHLLQGLEQIAHYGEASKFPVFRKI